MRQKSLIIVTSIVLLLNGNMAIADEKDVWLSILTYRNDTAKELLRSYGEEDAIIEALSEYRGKNKNHGHRTLQKKNTRKAKRTAGRTRERGTNPGADRNLNAAIIFLRQHAPQQ